MTRISSIDRENIGKTSEELIAKWNENFPDDQVVFSENEPELKIQMCRGDKTCGKMNGLDDRAHSCYIKALRRLPAGRFARLMMIRVGASRLDRHTNLI